MENKAFVRIQSSKNIRVTMGLNCQDVTNPDAHIPDRLKINPLWAKAVVLIKQGVGLYPSEIAEWNTVKALAADGILTIGEFVDDADENVKQEKETLIKNIEEAEQKSTEEKKKRGKKSLSDLTEE